MSLIHQNKSSYKYCNNCGKTGHAFHTCKHPIISIGLIVFRVVNNKFQFLMVKRRHSLGFVEFMRGKYPINNTDYLQNIVDEMTNEEKEYLKTKTFLELWRYLWGEEIGIHYRCEEKTSKDKIEELRIVREGEEISVLENMINNSKTNWVQPEWGFPKGRRNYHEKDLNCALREFEEETGYLKSNIKLIKNIMPYEEIFTGSNLKSYNHKYFVGYMDADTPISSVYEETEISEIRWMTYEDCMNTMRPYNLEKKDILTKINNVLHTYRLY